MSLDLGAVILGKFGRAHQVGVNRIAIDFTQGDNGRNIGHALGLNGWIDLEFAGRGGFGLLRRCIGGLCTGAGEGRQAKCDGQGLRPLYHLFEIERYFHWWRLSAGPTCEITVAVCPATN